MVQVLLASTQFMLKLDIILAEFECSLSFHTGKMFNLQSLLLINCSPNYLTFLMKKQRAIQIARTENGYRDCRGN